MKLSTGKVVLGATLAISLSAFTFPTSASIPPTAQTKSVERKNAPIQLAELGQKIDEKADEVKSEARGAKNAVVAAHRRHEAGESRHHTVGGKIDSKAGEMRDETTGAANAVEGAHARHEALEHSEGR